MYNMYYMKVVPFDNHTLFYLYYSYVQNIIFYFILYELISNCVWIKNKVINTLPRIDAIDWFQ
jgi:hypothetical protein